MNFRTVKTNKGVIDIPKLNLNSIKPSEGKPSRQPQSKSFIGDMGSSKLSSKSTSNLKSLNKSFCEDQKVKTKVYPQGMKVNLKLNSLKDKPSSKIINCAHTPENHSSKAIVLKTKSRNLSVSNHASHSSSNIGSLEGVQRTHSADTLQSHSVQAHNGAKLLSQVLSML